MDYMVLAKKLQSLPEIYIPVSLATNMPYVTCDPETFNDQAWLFHSSESINEFIKRNEDNIPLKGMVVKQEECQELFLDLHSMGINEVVFRDKGVEYKLELSKIVKIPDFSKLPEQKRPLMNQALQLSSIYFFQELRRKNPNPDSNKLNELCEEMYANLAKSRFLMPVQIVESGEHQGKLNLPFVTDKDGNKFQPIFADHAEYMKHIKKHKATQRPRILVVGIGELLQYAVADCQGYLLNPDGYCHPLNQQQLKYIQEQFGK